MSGLFPPGTTRAEALRILRRRSRKARREARARRGAIKIIEKQLGADGRWHWPKGAPWERMRRSERPA